MAVDDASRPACVEVLRDQKARRATAFLEAALRFDKRHGLRVQEILARDLGHQAEEFDGIR